MRKEVWKEGEKEQPGEMVVTDEWETVNQANALWARPKKDVSDEQHLEFYKHISHDFEPPLAWTHNRVEGSTEYTQLLYIPSKAPSDLFNRDKQAGLKLYVKRVFIMDDAEALMPTYLRFIKGVVDSADLPLNVSRELLQESRDVKAIREGNTRRVLSVLEDLAKHDVPADDASEDDKKDAGKFTKFYAEFGAVLKEGLGEDFSNKDSESFGSTPVMPTRRRSLDTLQPEGSNFISIEIRSPGEIIPIRGETVKAPTTKGFSGMGPCTKFSGSNTKGFLPGPVKTSPPLAPLASFLGSTFFPAAEPAVPLLTLSA
jgi:hypothetical protein